MKITHRLSATAGLAFAALCLAACANPPAPDPNDTASGGSAGAQGPGYCDAPPADMTQMDRWNELCSPGRR
ncbi:hypothetical protein [uncultured Amaricoccus sp.]|nr:hypothetical protein [uncultured Amaricoccus sp.]